VGKCCCPSSTKIGIAFIIVKQHTDSTMDEYTIIIAFDEESQKWYAQNDNIPVILEDYSIDTLISRVKLATPEILELNNMPHTGIHLTFKMEAQAVMV
jgi:hypothetical protein